MGKIIALGHISLDGYMADVAGKLDWIGMNEEISAYVDVLRRGAAGTINGRKTYELMDPFWPDVLRTPEKWPGWMMTWAKWVDGALKVVVSTTLEKISWKNTRLVRENVVEEMGRIKGEVEGDLLLQGSAQLLATLLGAGLVDEIAVTLNPIVLGQGKPYFAGLTDRYRLVLQEEQKIGNGAVWLRYGVVRK